MFHVQVFHPRPPLCTSDEISVFGQFFRVYEIDMIARGLSDMNMQTQELDPIILTHANSNGI